MKRTFLLTMLAVLTYLFLCSECQVIAQDFCKGNFDYDSDVDGTDATVFKENFGRSAFQNPCPPDGPSPVPQTGQTQSVEFRDDGDLEKGVALPNPRFTDNGDNTITDNLTGLMWTKSAALFGQKYTWDEAFDQVSLLNGASIYDDWRVPNVRELMSLIDFGEGDFGGSCVEGDFLPPLPEGHPFVDVKTQTCLPFSTYHWYWTSTSPGWAITQAIVFSFLPIYESRFFELVSHNDINEEHYVWPVRGGRSPLYQ